MTRTLRRVLLVLICLAVAAGALVLAARSYLHSAAAARRVAARLATLSGGPVHLDGVDIGVRGTSLHGLRLSEAGSGDSAPPWLTAEDVSADVSVGDLLKGEALPRRLDVAGAKVLLRFDREGRLLTRLPESQAGPTEWPAVRVTGGQVTIQQEGRPEFVARGVDAELTTEGDRLILAGGVADPAWGNWSLGGSLEPGAKAGSASLTGGQLHVTQAMLDDLPLISPKVWQEVQAEGDTPVELQVCFGGNGSKEGGVHYRVALKPEHATIHVPSVELIARDTRGNVLIEDGVVRLRDVTGRAADGDVRLSGTLDFASEPNVFDFAVSVQGLVVRDLPKSWSLPPQVEGRLTGRADLRVMVVDGNARTSGTGQGVIEDARVAGQPAEPIRLELHAAEGGYRFASGRPAPGHLSVAVALALATDGLLAPEGMSPGLLDQALSFPTRTAEWVVAKTLGGVGALTGALRRAAGFVQELATSAPPGQPPRYLETNLAMKDVDLEKFAQGLGLQLPFRVAGRLTFEVHAAIPIDTPRDIKTYRLNGHATLPRFSLNELDLADVRARVTLANGLLRLEEIRGDVPADVGSVRTSAPAGSFNGTARLQLSPLGDLTARIGLRDIPLSRVLSLVPGEARQARGRFSGNVDFAAPAPDLRNVATWKASGSLSAAGVRAFGWTLGDASADLRLEHGSLALTKGRGTLEGTPVTATATLGLTEPFPYRGKLGVTKADLAALQRLSPELRPPVAVAGRLDAEAEFQGILHPLSVRSSGTVAARDLTVEGLKARDLKFRWSGDADRLTLSDARAELYGGVVTGEGVLPLRGTASGSVSLKLAGVDVGLLQQDVPSIPLRLEGKAGGTVEGKLTAAGPDRPRAFTAKMDIQAPRLRVQGIPTERLHGTVDYRQGTADYRLEGESLGGTFQLNGELPARPAPEAPPPARESRLSIRGVRLSRLGAALGLPEALEPLGGVFNLDLSFRHTSPDGWPVGGGRFTLDRLRWGATELSPRVQGDLRLDRQELRLTGLAGTLGGGALRGQAAYNLREPGRRWFNVALDRAEVSRLLAPWPALAARVQGPLDLYLRGTVGREWRGDGRVLLAGGKVAGVTVDELRLPVEFTVVPARARGEVAVRDGTAELATGRATGRATWSFGVESRLNGEVRFFGIQLQTLVRQLADTGQSGQARVTGRVDIVGENVRSVDDVTADLTATLQQAQAFGFPVLSQIAPFVAPGQSLSAVFAGGDLRARLRGGVIRVQRLSLDGRVLRLLIEGTATLQGRLNLEVTATSGQLGVNPNTLRLLGLRLPAVGPIPVSLLLQATSTLSNRLIHLRVTGTYRDPSVQVEPLTLLTQEAAYFFLTRAGAPLP